MRAVVISEFEKRDTVGIREIDDPVPGDDEIVVDVKACSVNFTDLLSLDGKYQNNPPLPFTPGKDAAGIVSAVGRNITEFGIGDRVIAEVNHGAMAEKVACHRALACVLPDEVAFEDAAAVGLVYLTAYFALKVRGALRPGEVVLINGASGGVGLAAVGLARALGAKTVLGGLTSPGKADAIRVAGADAIIDLSVDDLRDGLARQVDAATDGHGADLVIDMVGGTVFDATLRAVHSEGRVVVVGFTSGTIPSLRTNYLLLKNISVVGITVAIYMRQASPEIAKALRVVLDLLISGRISPNIMARFPFEQFMDAIMLLEDRKIVGKSVLLI